jgi:hypothetical protein
MMDRRKESFYEDTLNTFIQEDTKFYWSRGFKYYSTFPPTKRSSNDIWTSRIAKAGCVLEVFDAKYLVMLCIDEFDKS